MEGLRDVMGTLWFKVGCSVASVVLGYVIVKRLTRREKKIAPKDTVILYQIGRGPKAPSISPFPLKLETYLRMAKIPYENDHTGKFSSKGKTPWMEYNGVVVADSQFCIEYLNKERGIDLNAHLTAEQKAIARAFQKMTEENLYWTMCYVTFGDDLTALYRVIPYKGLVRWLLSRLIRRNIQQEMWGHGIGRHAKDDILHIGFNDLNSLSDFLGCLDQNCSAVVEALAYFQREKKIAPKDTVILYQIGRGPKAPSISPFPLKLETYLRMAKIPYENDHTGKFSSKGKTPWMEYNGVVVADSQFCIEYLNKERGIDLNAHLTAEQKAIARAFQKMTEENLYWTMCYVTFGDDLTALYRVIPYKGLVRWLLSRLIRRNIQQEMWGHGIGRHAKDDILHIGFNDLNSLSDFLGQKPFLMGDEPCETDCAIFGMLAQVVWHMPNSPHEKWIKEEFPNLTEYCYRMKERFWPDWDENITEPERKKME
ncbi:failed axon connections homolog [Lingula anatina]|uniref:Failed axon connections homolog n=1 Tax=Lingula anatina TaxID=7574 RepID=A0A2R2MMH8_LINAN|nr:failed axon connections homolog [Lingula anatina]|eukprot:XP_023931415.1 failed axon connections homolog [Lingula anatina]